jgi:dinuclear metal center YbgI/SA1388 family protein
MATIGEIVAAVERRYDPAWAEAWDTVGLICGDPTATADRVLVAVDPVEAVVDEALAAGADLLLTHHPLFLGGTDSVAATTAKGRLVHRLVTSGAALYVAHTNADVARPGVSDALAATLALHDVRPLEPGADRGLGRIGVLAEPTTLADLVTAVALALPATRWGIRAAGDPARPVSTVAVCGGSGAELADQAAAVGADVLITADLKHHRTSEAMADLRIGLVDVAHWASEQPWVVAAARLLAEDLRSQGITVEATASTIVTDPWTLHAHSSEDAEATP